MFSERPILVLMACIEIDMENQMEPLKASVHELDKMLHCIENNVLPLTREGVSKGNKVRKYNTIQWIFK